MVTTVIDQAVVIRHWDYSETSQTVSLLTRRHGLIRGLAKGGRREKGPFSGGLELLTRGEIVAIVKPTVDLATLTEWDLQEVFWAPRRDLPAHRIGLYLLDIVHHLVTDRDPHPELFDDLVSAARALEKPGAMGTALLRFQWSSLVLAGYRPELANAGVPVGQPETGGFCGFSPSAGGLVPDPGRNEIGGAGETVWRVRAATVETLRAIEQLSDDHEPGFDHRDVERGNRLLAAYIRHIAGRALPSADSLFGRAGPWGVAAK